MNLDKADLTDYLELIGICNNKSKPLAVENSDASSINS